jgi:hypothetical protein
MTDIVASSAERMPEWQLLAEFAVTGQPGNKRQLLDQVTDAVQGLNLELAQLERIQQVLVLAVARAMRSEEPGAMYPLRIRIWVRGDCASGRGLGFFLLEKQGNDPESVAAEKTERHVELLLYQERGC